MADRTDQRALLTRTLEHALEYRHSLGARAVAAAASTETVYDQLSALGGMPAEGTAPALVLEELVRLAAPGLTAMSGPRFFGWVTGGTLPEALAADWLTSAWDQNAGPATGAPAAAAFELLALRWVVELLGLPEQARGALVTGASMANFTALAGARSQVLAAAGWDVEQDGLFEAPRVRVLVGRERHSSIDRALRMLGFGKRALSIVDADGQGRMRAEALQRELDGGTGPVIVCAQAGNVDSGAFDPLDRIHDVVSGYRARCGEELAWLHVDGAFGLWARATPRWATHCRGAELADSWATDAHKMLNVPYDSGLALTRHPQAQRRALAIGGAYLSSGSALSLPNPGSFSPELSRRARGFALWAALRGLGRSGVAALVERCAEHARQLATELAATPGLRVLNEVVFNQVVLAAEPPSGVPPHDWTRELGFRIQCEGTCYTTPTLWRGAPALRFSVVNADTVASDITSSAQAVRRVYRELCSDPAGSVVIE